MHRLSLGAALVLFGFASPAPAEDEKRAKAPPLRSPEAVVDAASQEREGAEARAAKAGRDDGDSLFDIEIVVDGKAIDVTLDPDRETGEES